MRLLNKVAGSTDTGVVGSGDLKVTQDGSPDMNVTIATGDLLIPYLDYMYHCFFTATNQLPSVITAPGSNSNIFAIVAYVDLTVVSSASSNNPGAAKFISVAGTAGVSPVAPTGSAIQSAVGAGNPYVTLAWVTLASTDTSITNAKITDKRAFFVLGSPAKYGFSIPGALAIANNLSWNPTVPFTSQVSTMYAYVKTAPVGSSLTVQVYNITQSQIVASLSISAGSNTATTTSMTNASVNAGDVLRLDVTAIGSTTAGSDVSVILY
jgi:hypothetical protein